MENIPTTTAPNNTSSSSMVDFPSKSEGIAWCSVFALEAFLILVGNLVTIVLFAVNKKLRKKSLLLVINMAFCDAMVGAVSLPMDIFFTGTSYQLWTGKLQRSLYVFMLIVQTVLLLASLISAAMITTERFYAIYWPVKHRTLSMRAYRIVIFMIWTLAILVCTVCFVSTLKKRLAAYFVLSLCFLFLLFIVCGLNIGIWRNFQHGNMASQQQNRTKQNQRLTKTLSFVSFVAFLSWLPIVIYFWIRIFKVSMPLNTFRVGVFLCYFNCFCNPIVYALRIPEFKQALCFCRLRCKIIANREDNGARDNMAVALTPVTQLRTLPTDPSHVQLTFEQKVMDTKL